MRDLLAGLRARLRPAPRFDPAPVEPSARERLLEERTAAARDLIDQALAESPADVRHVDWLLDVRGVLAPPSAGSTVLRSSAPVVRGRSS